MPQNWNKIILSLLVIPVLFTACKKQFSTDKPLTTVYTPSIIINSENQVLYGINPANGLKNWQYSLPLTAISPSAQFQTSPLLYGSRIYISGTRGGVDTLYKINAETGALVSKFFVTPAVAFNVQATPIAAGNLIYLAATNDTLYAIDTGTGATQWKYSPNTGGSLISSPVIYNGMLFGATSDGLVFALATTQTPTLPGGPVSATWTLSAPGASFYSSPAVSAPYLYIGSAADSNMYCIFLSPIPAGSSTGILRWTFKTNGPILSSPAAGDGVCVFGSSDFNVYCLDTSLMDLATSPRPRWATRTNNTVISSPVIVNQVVYVGSYDYNLYALNILDGSVKWKFASTALIRSSPLVYGNTVYIGSYDKNLYAVDTALGTLKWSYNTNGQIGCSPVIDDLSGSNQINSQISGFTN